MKATTTTVAVVNIHLRARTQDRKLIDQAAESVGANRSQFMMASALKETPVTVNPSGICKRLGF